MLNLPAHTSNKLIDNTFCGNSIENIIKKNYRSNTIKWQNIYEETIEEMELEQNKIISDKVNKHVQCIEDDMQLNQETKINNKLINKKV